MALRSTHPDLSKTKLIKIVRSQKRLFKLEGFHHVYLYPLDDEFLEEYFEMAQNVIDDPFHCTDVAFISVPNNVEISSNTIVVWGIPCSVDTGIICGGQGLLFQFGDDSPQRLMTSVKGNYKHGQNLQANLIIRKAVTESQRNICLLT